MHLARARSCVRWLAVALLGACWAASPGLAATQLHWMQPAGSAAVSEFRVYAGPSLDEGELVYAGKPVADAGVYTALVQIDAVDQGLPVGVWITASNEAGEGAPSNAIRFGLPGDGALDAVGDVTPGEVALDTDGDGIPDDGGAGSFACASGESQGCYDNCPYAVNPGQEDGGGVGDASLPDGIGNACQCGDVSGDGRVTAADAAIIAGALKLPPRAVMEHPELCDVGGSQGCTGTDARIVRGAVRTPPNATIVQQCEPDQPLVP